MSKSLRLIALLALVILHSGCETVSQWSNDALNLVGLGESKPKKKTEKSKKKEEGKIPEGKGEEGSTSAKNDADAKKDSEEVTDSSGKQAEAEKKIEIVIERNTQAPVQKVQKKDLKKNRATPEFKEDAPVNILRRIGGAARFMTADDVYVYLDFPQYFSVYDTSLTMVARLPVAFPVVSVRREIVDDRTLLFLKEENNALEILELKKDEQGSGSKLVKLDGYDMGGNFTVLDASHVVNFDKEKIEIWNFTDVQKAKIERELPIGDGDDIMMIGSSVFLSRHGFLDIMKATDYSLQSSLRIGRRFGFIGGFNIDGKSRLVLSLLSAEGDLQGLQTLVLADDGASIKDFDQTVLFETPLRKYSFDPDKAVVLGLEVPKDKKESGRVHLIGIREGRILRGEMADMKDLQAWALAQGKLYLATGQQISINEITLSGDVIGKADLIKALTGKKTLNPPLAQIGSTSDIKAEYALKPVKSLFFMSDSRRVALWDTDHLAIMEMAADRKSHRIYATENLGLEDFTIREVTGDAALLYDKVLWSDIGWILYSNESGNFYLLDLTFQKIAKLPLPQTRQMTSWHWFTPDGNDEYLAVVSEKMPAPGSSQKTPASKNKKSSKPGESTDTKSADDNKPKPFLLSMYKLLSPEKFELAFELQFSEKPFPLFSSEAQLVVVSGSGFQKYDLSEMKNPRALEDEGSRGVFPEKHDVLSVRMNPRNPDNPLADRIFMLIKKDDNLGINAFALNHPDKHYLMNDFLIESSHFEEMVIAEEGRLLILPTPDGTLFYDITDLAERVEKSFWPLPSESAALTGEGSYLCTALGSRGVYCGTLLF